VLGCAVLVIAFSMWNPDPTEASSHVIIASIAPAGASGRPSSMAIGTDGFPVIAYEDGALVKVAHCNDAFCLAPVFPQTVGTGWDPSLAIGSDGHPVISWYKNGAPDDSLQFTRCDDTDCSSVTTLALDDNADPLIFEGWDSSVTIGDDGFPVISYIQHDLSGGGGDAETSLKVAKCDTVNCNPASATISTVETESILGQFRFTSIAILPSTNNPVIAYQAPGQGLQLATCNDPACAGGDETITVPNFGNTGWWASMAIGTDGNPVISHRQGGSGDLKVTHISPTTTSILDSTGDVGLDSSIAIGSDGFPVISYFDQSNGDLKVAKCSDVTCTAAPLITALDSAGDVGWGTSIAISTIDGFPIISYYDHTAAELKVAKCFNHACGDFLLPLIPTGEVHIQGPGATIIALPLFDVGTPNIANSALRIQTGSGVKIFDLLPTAHPDASPVRIQTPGGVRAIRQ
jgi:hypothetical protein